MQHQDNLKGHVFSGKMINERSLINLINNMPYKHFTSKQKNELSVLLRTKAKKKEIAKLLGKGRTTIWRERKRGKGKNGKYYTRKSNRLAKEKKKTMTYDNGVTFAEHELIEKETGLIIYFAYPYHSWERGCNENANGLLRQFFPKKINFATITQKEIQKAVRLLNHRPRKRLNYSTPYEVFN